MTSTHVHSLYKQNSPLCRFDYFFGGSCEGIVRLQCKRGKTQVLLSTVVDFTLVDLLETNKIQEAKFRDCHWCISIHFSSNYFDEK